jgi:hydroxymethylglutaryl-CoA lyase
MSTEDAASRIIAMAQEASAQNKTVQVSVQSAFGCGFEGAIPVERVLTIVRRYLDAGLKIISLADTAGHAHPFQVKRLFEEIFSVDPTVECTCHFHNTYGMGMANTYAAMEIGVRCFESSFAGLGGCPFTKVAAGNVCTEDFVHFLQRTGKRGDVDLDRLIFLAREVSMFFGREMPGLVHKTGPLQSNIRNI